MANYRLSELAAADVESIVEFTVETFGALQAVKYHASLERTFQLLADFPRIGLPTYDLRPGLYRLPHKSHTIFYTHGLDHILIARVLFARADFKRYF